MALPPFRKLNSKGDELFSRGQDNVSEPLRVLGTKKLLITGESVLFLEATVTVPTDWIAPTLLNSWVNYSTIDAAWTEAGYRRVSDGCVEIRGLVRNGSAIPTVIFTLPAGYRPPLNLLWPSISNNLFARIDVRSNGDVWALTGTTSDFSINVRFAATSPAPIPASCWPIQIPCALKVKPNAVLLAEAIETASGAAVVAANPDWEWDTQAGQNFVIINNVPMLPAATYNLTFAVFGET